MNNHNAAVYRDDAIHPNEAVYLLDADALLTAYHHHYAPERCPGFWDSLEHYLAAGRLVIIDRVYDEITHLPWLAEWSARAGNAEPSTTALQPVVDAYRRLMDWVQENPQFTPAARWNFANGTDGWLAAYAMANGAVVVSNAASAPNAASRSLLPELCNQFGVPCISLYRMLGELGTRFVGAPV